MPSTNPGPNFTWQNPVLRGSIFPHRLKKLREFLLWYWEVDKLAGMVAASEVERKTAWENAATGIRARRAEWQRDFNAAFDDLKANDKAFAVKTTEKYQIWYLQDRSRYPKKSNYERIRRLLDLFDQRDELPAEVDLNEVPDPKTLTRAMAVVEAERLQDLDHDTLLKAILERFDAEPDRFPAWLQYMTVHFTGMRYKSAHGSWADPADLLARIRDSQKFSLPELEPNDDLSLPADQAALNALQAFKPNMPAWLWKDIVRLTPLRVTEVSEEDTDWETRVRDRKEFGFDNNFWAETFARWFQRDITSWRLHHRKTLDPIVSRAVCNEISEHILHLHWLTPSGGLNFKVDWYRHRARKTASLPTNHPRKVMFKRATSVADFQPGASIFWLVWYRYPPNSANYAYEIADFNFFPDGVSLNGGSKKKRGKGKGGRKDEDGWTYGYSENRLIRTRKLYDSEIQQQLNAKANEMEGLRRQEALVLEGEIRKLGQILNQKQAVRTDSRSNKVLQREKRQKENRLKVLKNLTQFKREVVGKEQKRLRRELAGEIIKDTLRWRHEATVVSVETMSTGSYVWTFETETEIGLNRRRLYDLLGSDNNDDNQIFVGRMPSLDNLSAGIDPDKFMRGTFMDRDQAATLRLRLQEMLRRDLILPGQYAEATYSVPPTIAPQTDLPEQPIEALPPAEQPRWVQIKPNKHSSFITNMFYKKRNGKGFPVMIPAALEHRRRLMRGTLVGVSKTHKENETDAGDGLIRADGKKFFSLITQCEAHPEAVGTFVLSAFTEDVTDLDALKQAQEEAQQIQKVKNEPAPPLLAQADPDDDAKTTINCWERKLARTRSGLPAFRLPDVGDRLQLSDGWQLQVKPAETAENGYFHKIVTCSDMPEAEGLYLRKQDVDLIEEEVETRGGR
jgi:hypothetical protein